MFQHTGHLQVMKQIKCEDVTQVTNAQLSCVWIPQCIHISYRVHHVTLYWNITYLPDKELTLHETYISVSCNYWFWNLPWNLQHNKLHNSFINSSTWAHKILFGLDLLPLKMVLHGCTFFCCNTNFHRILQCIYLPLL